MSPFLVGILTGYFVFSYFVDDNNLQSQSWLNVYWMLGSISFIAFLLLFTAKLDESQAKAENADVPPSDFSQMFKLLALPLVLVFIICAFFYVLIEQSIMSWLPTYNNSKVLQLPTSLSIQMAIFWAEAPRLAVDWQAS
ncbi:MAG: MFS transporter [Saprospiraceae bacterium]